KSSSGGGPRRRRRAPSCAQRSFALACDEGMLGQIPGGFTGPVQRKFGKLGMAQGNLSAQQPAISVPRLLSDQFVQEMQCLERTTFLREETGIIEPRAAGHGVGRESGEKGFFGRSGSLELDQAESQAMVRPRLADFGSGRCEGRLVSLGRALAELL